MNQFTAMLKLPKSVLMGVVQKQFTKKFKREVVEASIVIDYVNNLFTLQIWDKERMSVKNSAPVSEFSDMSGALLQRITERVKQEQGTEDLKIDLLDLRVFFESHKSKARVFFFSEGENLFIDITEVF